MKSQLRAALLIFVSLTLVTGVGYASLVTLDAQSAFHFRANGSVLERDGKPVGSELIGQPFDDPRYFWGRPSATGPMAYNAAASTGSNLGRPTRHCSTRSSAASGQSVRRTPTKAVWFRSIS